MPVGGIILLAAAALVFLGFAHRILDRMHLTDGQAIVVLILMAVLSLVNVTVSRANPRVILNIGGIVVPIGLVIYVLVRATAAEKARSLLTAVATGAVLYGISKTFDFEEGQQIIAPIYLWGLSLACWAWERGLEDCIRHRHTRRVALDIALHRGDSAHCQQPSTSAAQASLTSGGAGIVSAVLPKASVRLSSVSEAPGTSWRNTRRSSLSSPTPDRKTVVQQTGSHVVELRHRNENGGGRDE